MVLPNSYSCFNTKILLLVSVVSLLGFARHVTALTCYNFTSTDGRFNVNAPSLQGCNACTRVISIYKQPAGLMSTYNWGCSAATPITQGPSQMYPNPRCIDSGMIAYYSDGSMYSASCGCCTDNCNNASFKCGNVNYTNSASAFHYYHLLNLFKIASLLVAIIYIL